MPADGKRWLAVGALTLSVLTIGFDITIMNVALPTIATELSTGTEGLQWIVNAYILFFAGLLLPFGAVADRFGRRRLLLRGRTPPGRSSRAGPAWVSARP
jgi:MFS family permease